MRLLRFTTILFYILITTSACSAGFASFYIKKAGSNEKSAEPSQLTEGYLKLIIDSSVANARMPDKPKGFAYLSVTLQNKEGLEFPVLLYSFSDSKKTSVSGTENGQASYIQFLSGKPGSFTLKAQAIPDNFAASYAAAVKRFNPNLDFLPINDMIAADTRLAVAAALLGELSRTIEAEGNRIWTTEETIGLTGDFRSFQPDVPLIAFLIPDSESNSAKDEIYKTEFVRCGTSVKYEICATGQTVPFSKYPYIIIRSDFSDYRPLTDMAPAVDCSRSEEDFVKIDNAVRMAGLTETQRRYERKTAEKLRLLLDLRKEKNISMDRLAELLNQNFTMNSPSNDPYWTKYFAQRNESLNSCISSDITSRGLKERVWFEVINKAIAASEKSGQLSVSPEFQNLGNPDKTKELESILSDIVIPMEKFNLSRGSVYDFLLMEKNHLEKMLRQLDESIKRDIARGKLKPSEAVSIISDRLESTSCETCRPVLEAAWSSLKMQEATASLETTQAKLMERQQEVSRLQLHLTSLRREAAQLAKLAETSKLTDSKNLASVEESINKSNQIMENGTNAEDPGKLATAITELESSVKPLRAALADLE
jgi:hypothetical protein